MTPDSKYPMKIEGNPAVWIDREAESSDNAIYTCEECDARHKGFNPDECIECGHSELGWSYDYGYQGRFA